MPVFSRTRDEPNAIVGAARRVHLDRRDEVERLRERSTTAWQRAAWKHYDAIGAIKYGFNYFAAVASRVRLYAGYQDEASDVPVPIGQIGNLSRSLVSASRQELRKLDRGRGGQPNLIRSSVLNLLVPGECYLVGASNAWSIRSTSELRFESDDRIRLVLTSQGSQRLGTYLPDDAFVARIWRTHPEYSDDADSSLKGVQDDCAELLLLSRLIRSSARSRLNAGLLYVADELRFQRSSDLPQTAPQPNVDPLEEELTVALTEPIGETDSPSEVVPMLVRGPYQFKDGIVTVDLSRTFDETVIKRHDQIFNYILNGLDLPKDIITGFQNVRYSNAREITTDMYRAHVEPMVLIICEALTTVFLRPRLIARGYDPRYVERVHVWYDPSGVLVKPDRSEDADKGYTRLLISGDTWRRAHGFSPSDAPTDEEIARRIALAGSVAPTTTFDFLRLIAPELVLKAESLARDAFDAASQETTPDTYVQPETPVTAPQPNLETSPDGRTTPAARPEPKDDVAHGPMPPSAHVLAVFDTIRAITAAASQTNGAQVNGAQRNGAHVASGHDNGSEHVVRDRTLRLNRALDLERRLREGLFTYLNETVHRALERAGARVVSKIRNDHELKSLVSNVPMTSVFARVPDDRRASLKLDESELVRDTIERAHDGYVNLVLNAQRRGWRVLGSDVVSALSKAQGARVESSWRWLVPLLVSYAALRLREPHDEVVLVDLSTIRQAMSRAGGVIDPDVAPELAHSGRAIITDDALDATCWQFNGYRWVYGANDVETFAPHLALDDTTFPDWESERLSNDKPWPAIRYFYPGDHDGCRCDALPVPTAYVVSTVTAANVEVGGGT